MIITSTELVGQALPLVQPWKTARGIIRERLGWVLALHTDKGLDGLGEALPLVEAGTENHEACHTALERLAEALKGANPDEIIEHLHDLTPGCPAALCAAETALLSILAASQDQQPAQRLNPKAASSVKVNAIAGALSMSSEHQVTELMAQGFQVIKLKVGLDDPASEVRELTHLCTRLMPGVSLRLDANGAWGPDQAAVFMAGLANLPIESLEEPLAEPNFAILKSLQAQTPFPLALDESLWRVGPETVLSNCPTKRVVLKPMAAGGPLSTYRLGKKAHEVGLETIVTTTIDGRIGTQAAAQAAAALDQQKLWAHGLSTGAWLKQNTGVSPSDSAEIRIL